MSKRITAGHLPRLTGRAVLIDMDGTLTPTEDLGNYLIEVLYEMVAQKRGVSRSEAEQLVRNVVDPQNEPITAASLKAIGIDFDEYWQELMRWQEDNFTPYEDAVEMIRQLQAMGVRMYPATTNSSLACRAKLARAGLADRSGDTYFNELFGGSEVHPEGKRSPDFFRAILKRVGLNGDRVVAVGDNIKADFEYARDAGIQQVVIVCRDQPQPWTKTEKGPVVVNSLALVPRMLQPPANL